MNKLKAGLIGSSQLSFPGDKEGQFNRQNQNLYLSVYQEYMQNGEV